MSALARQAMDICFVADCWRLWFDIAIHPILTSAPSGSTFRKPSNDIDTSRRRRQEGEGERRGHRRSRHSCCCHRQGQGQGGRHGPGQRQAGLRRRCRCRHCWLVVGGQRQRLRFGQQPEQRQRHDGPPHQPRPGPSRWALQHPALLKWKFYWRVVWVVRGWDWRGKECIRL